MRTGGIILCGGQSRRMGRDKATLPFGPETMLQRVVRLLSEVIDPRDLVVVAAIDQNLPELPGAVSIARDEHPERGPLEGLAAGLRKTEGGVEAVYVTACDAPLLVPGFVQALFDRLGKADAVVPCEGERRHPLCAVYRPSALPVVESLLKTNALRLQSLAEELRTTLVNVESLRFADPHLHTLRNVNSHEDYMAVLAMAGLAASDPAPPPGERGGS